jgi:hypothetical protein
MVNLSPHPVNQETQTSVAYSTVIKEQKTTIKGKGKKEKKKNLKKKIYSFTR